MARVKDLKGQTELMDHLAGKQAVYIEELRRCLIDLLRETDDGTQLCARQFVDRARALLARTPAE